jgi:phage gpG-like protein
MAPGDAFLEVKFDDKAVRVAMDRARKLTPSQRQAFFTSVGGRAVTDTVLNQFGGEKSPDGVKWKPSQRVRRKGGKTLQLHGYLVGSITYNASPEALQWGSPLRYAAAMQAGATIKVYPRSQQIYRRIVRGQLRSRFVKKDKANFVSWATIGGDLKYGQAHEIKIPARPYLGISQDFALEIRDASVGFMMRILNGSVQ